MGLDEICKNLEALTHLRNSVFERDETLNRLFGLHQDGPTRVDLDKSIAIFEAKVPGFHVGWLTSERQYGLFPNYR